MIVWFLYLTAAAAAILWAALGGIASIAELWKLIFAYVISLLGIHLAYVLFLAVYSLFCPKRELEEQNDFSRACCAGVGDLFCFYAGVRVHLGGLEKLPKEEKFLFVCNHRSMFDPLVVMGAMKEYNISFISKPSNLNLPIAGPIARQAGFLPIDRENNREALKTILKAAEYLKKGICNIGIYPEGTRSKTGEMLPFHAGSFKIAQRAGAPIAVACVRGSENVRRPHLFRAVDIYLDILELIPAERVKAMSTNELADYSRALMEQHLALAA